MTQPSASEPLREAAQAFVDWDDHAGPEDCNHSPYADRLRAALATPPPALDAAWAAAEAALPDGWAMGVLANNSQRGHTAMQTWLASCFGPTRTFARERRAVGRRIAYGPTPAAVLHALAARLADDKKIARKVLTRG